MKSSEVGTSDDEKEELRRRFKAAGIPLRLWRAQSGQFISRARDLFDYVRSGAYATDLTEHRGVCLSGIPIVRSDLLAMLAKAQAAAGQSVRFLTVHALIYLIENDAEQRTELAKVKNLYIDAFEKEFNKDFDCPYTFYQRMEVEDFLKSRIDAGLLNNYAAATEWGQLHWWSNEFIAFQIPFVRDVDL